MYPFLTLFKSLKARYSAIYLLEFH